MTLTIFSGFCFKLQSLFLSLEAPTQSQFLWNKTKNQQLKNY